MSSPYSFKPHPPRPHSSSPSRHVISLDNFTDSSTRLTSPRSLESCRRIGIEPSELIYRPPAYFALPTLTELQRDTKYMHYEQKRQAKLHAAIQERKKIISSGTFISSSSAPSSPSSSPTRSSSPSKSLYITAIEMEQAEVARMAARQLKLMKTALHYQLKMNETELSKKLREDKETQRRLQRENYLRLKQKNHSESLRRTLEEKRRKELYEQKEKERLNNLAYEENIRKLKELETEEQRKREQKRLEQEAEKLRNEQRKQEIREAERRANELLLAKQAQKQAEEQARLSAVAAQQRARSEQIAYSQRSRKEKYLQLCSKNEEKRIELENERRNREMELEQRRREFEYNRELNKKNKFIKTNEMFRNIEEKKKQEELKIKLAKEEERYKNEEQMKLHEQMMEMKRRADIERKKREEEKQRKRIEVFEASEQRLADKIASLLYKRRVTEAKLAESERERRAAARDKALRDSLLSEDRAEHIARMQRLKSYQQQKTLEKINLNELRIKEINESNKKMRLLRKKIRNEAERKSQDIKNKFQAWRKKLYEKKSVDENGNPIKELFDENMLLQTFMDESGFDMMTSLANINNNNIGGPNSRRATTPSPIRSNTSSSPSPPPPARRPQQNTATKRPMTSIPLSSSSSSTPQPPASSSSPSPPTTKFSSQQPKMIPRPPTTTIGSSSSSSSSASSNHMRLGDYDSQQYYISPAPVAKRIAFN